MTSKDCLDVIVIKDFVFSPDVKYVAAISEDGCLRVIDAVAEQYVFNQFHQGHSAYFHLDLLIVTLHTLEL